MSDWFGEIESRGPWRGARRAAFSAWADLGDEPAIGRRPTRLGV